MRVRIKSVTLPDGTPRADDKYPVRIGSTKVTTRNSVYVLKELAGSHV